MKASRAHIGYSHYQSLWNGAERIYSGELVRVLASLDQLPQEHLSLSPGAERRSFFLHVDGLYRHVEKGMAMCGGTVYELRELSGDMAVEGGMKMFETPSAVKEGKKPEKNSATPFGKSLPEPPPGYAFHPVLTKNIQCHFAIESIAGRYHHLPPHLANSPQKVRELIDAEEKRQGELAEDEEVTDGYFSVDLRSVILAGLLRGNLLFMKVRRGKNSFELKDLADEIYQPGLLLSNDSINSRHRC